MQTRSNQKKIVISAPIRAKLVRWAVGIFYCFPWRAIAPVSLILAWLSKAFNSRAFATTRTNLEHCFPELETAQRELLAYRSMREDWRTVLETLVLWNRGLADLNIKVRTVNIEPVLEAIAAHEPLIIAALHMGNWELAGHAGGSYCNGTVLYRPIKIQELNEFITSRRRQPGWEYETTTRKGVLRLYRRLREGGTVMVFPDQEPISSGGEYAGFFGVPALTGTLIPQLVSRTGAKVYYMVCLRQQDGYTLQLHPSRMGSDEQEAGTALLNREIEQIVRQSPEQFLWSYKRFKTPATGANFYLK